MIVFCGSCFLVNLVSAQTVPTINKQKEIKKDTTIAQTDTLKNLDVITDRSQYAKQTATGTIYYLSKKAQAAKDPFRALQEIPTILSNPSSQSVTMADGSSMLILIDGNQINSGIAPIDPKDIESVEVREVVSARYLKDGYKHILNIKLKKNASSYRFFEVATRHDLIPRYGFGVVYFEVGNPRVSLYGRYSGSYKVKNDSWTTSLQQDTGYQRYLSTENRTYNPSMEGELQFKWLPTSKDFLIAHVFGKGFQNKKSSDGTGYLRIIKNGQFQPQDDFTMASSSRDKSAIFTSTLYYKHTFAPENTLEATLAYNRNGNTNTSSRWDDYSLADDYYNYFKYKNRRSSGRFNIDYSYDWNNINSLAIGNSLRYTDDKIDKISTTEPVFLHKEVNDYLYASFSSRFGKKFMYMASLGADAYWLKVADISNHYIRPHGVLSLVWNINQKHTLRLYQTILNSSPDVGMLNPYNTSSDSLLVVKGNPYLMPSKNYVVNFNYQFRKNKWTIQPGVLLRSYWDMLQGTGYTDNKGIYTSTYINSGTFKKLQYSLYAGRSIKDGFLSFVASGNVYYFENMKPRYSYSSQLSYNQMFGKWYLAATMAYVNKYYDLYSTTVNKNMVYGLWQLSYYFTDLFYISLAVESYCEPYSMSGTPRSETTVRNGTYYNFSTFKPRHRGFTPWLLVRYTFRKNKSQEIKEQKVLESYEKGIKL